jgi:hypothetical protein
MTRVDLALVDATEAVCQRFQRLTGRTSIWLAFQLTNLTIVLYFAGAAVWFLRLGAAPRTALGIFCAVLLYALAKTVFRVPIEAYESSAYRRVARGLRNPRRVRDASLRLSFLALSVLLAYPLVALYPYLGVLPVLVFSYSLIVLTTVVLYLLACDPLPPSTRTERVWLESRAPTPVRVPGTTGDGRR